MEREAVNKEISRRSIVRKLLLRYFIICNVGAKGPQILQRAYCPAPPNTGTLQMVSEVG